MTYGPRALTLLKELSTLKAIGRIGSHFRKVSEDLTATGLGHVVARYLRHESNDVALLAKKLLAGTRSSRRTVRPCSDDDSEAPREKAKDFCGEPGRWTRKQDGLKCLKCLKAMHKAMP